MRMVFRFEEIMIDATEAATETVSPSCQTEMYYVCNELCGRLATCRRSLPTLRFVARRRESV